MQRFVNLKVGSVFGFFHPETAVSVSVFNFKKTNKKRIKKLEIGNRNCGFGFWLWFGSENRMSVPTTT